MCHGGSADSRSLLITGAKAHRVLQTEIVLEPLQFPKLITSYILKLNLVQFPPTPPSILHGNIVVILEKGIREDLRSQISDEMLTETSLNEPG